MFSQDSSFGRPPRYQSNTFSSPQCPLHLHVGFNSMDNELAFTWDFRAVEATRVHSSRHIIALDFDQWPRQLLVEVMRYFYKLLPLGDFIKIVDFSNGKRRTSWQEKTSSPLELKQLNKQYPEPKTRSIHGLLNDFEKYNDQFTLAIFIFNSAVLSDNFIGRLSDHMKKNRYEGGLTFFISQQSKKDIRFQLLPLATRLYNFASDRVLWEAMKNYMSLHTSIRVKRVDFRLSCLTSGMELSHTPGQKWVQVNNNSIKKVHYYLDNLSLFGEHIRLELGFKRRHYFFVEFGGELCNGEKFVMDGQFEVETSPRPISEPFMGFTSERGREMSAQLYNSDPRFGMRYQYHSRSKVVLRESILEVENEEDVTQRSNEGL